MNPFKIPTQEQFEAELVEHGFSKTDQHTATGTYWKSKTGKHLMVTYPYEGMYPDFIAKDIRARMLVLSRDPMA